MYNSSSESVSDLEKETETETQTERPVILIPDLSKLEHVYNSTRPVLLLNYQRMINII